MIRGAASQSEQYTAASAACTGAVTASVVWSLVRNGNTVTLSLPVTTSAGVAQTSFAYGTAIPAQYRPAADKAFVSAPIIDNNANQSAPGMIYIAASTGVITVYKNGTAATAFTVTQTAGLVYSTVVQWNI